MLTLFGLHINKQIEKIRQWAFHSHKVSNQSIILHQKHRREKCASFAKNVRRRIAKANRCRDAPPVITDVIQAVWA